MGRKKKEKAINDNDNTQFRVTLSVNGKEFNSRAGNLETAILRLPRINLKTRGVITVSKGTKTSKPIILSIANFNKLFYPGMTGEVQRISFVKRYTILS